MAFMIPVVRNDWDMWMRSGKPRPSAKSSRNNGQTTESRSDDTNLSTTPSRNGIMADTNRKRSLAIEIRKQQHLRISGGSLPSNFQSAHVTLPLSGSSSRHRRPLNSASRLHSMHSSYRVGKSRAFEPESVVAEDEATASLPNSFEFPRLRKLVHKIPCKSFIPVWLIVSAVRYDLIQHPLPSEEIITVLVKTVAARRHEES